MVRKVIPGAVGVVAAVSLAIGLAPPVLAHEPAAAPAGTTAKTTAGTAAGTMALTGDITYSVPSGTFQGALSVSLSTTVAGAQVRYTTDGRPPTAASSLYSAPVRLTRTTQLRAQAYVGGVATGEPGTSLYVARSFDAAHDIPVLVLDAYGQGRPGREYADVVVLEFQPAGGTTRLSAAPVLASRAGFHLRGQSSSTFPKAPYRLELRDNTDDDLDQPLLGLPEDSDWVLRGPYTDKALIRDAFVYGLGREMGMAAPRYAFAEVYLNTDAQLVGADDYQGVYLLVETIKNSKNRLDLKQLDEDDLTEPKIHGGYIWKFDWTVAEEPILRCTGNAATCWNYLEVVDPSPLQPQQATWLRNHVQQFNDMLHGPDFADPATGYPAWINVDSFVDQLIINELSRELDSYVRSAYFHKDREGKITAGPLWDYDLSFGVGGIWQNDQIAGWQYEQLRRPHSNLWFNRLMADPAFVNRVRVRWQQLRRGLLSDAQLGARISGLGAPLPRAAQRNFQKWNNLTSRRVSFFTTPTAPTWQGQVDAMHDWMTRRVAWLDTSGGWGAGGGPTTPVATTAPPRPTRS